MDNQVKPSFFSLVSIHHEILPTLPAILMFTL